MILFVLGSTEFELFLNRSTWLYLSLLPTRRDMTQGQWPEGRLRGGKGWTRAEARTLQDFAGHRLTYDVSLMNLGVYGPKLIYLTHKSGSNRKTKLKVRTWQIHLFSFVFMFIIWINQDIFLLKGRKFLYCIKAYIEPNSHLMGS